MKKEIGYYLLLALALLSLLLPAFSVYIPGTVDAETAALFPSGASMLDVALKGNGFLPLDAIPALGLTQVCQWMLVGGLALLVAGGICGAIGKRRTLCASLALTAGALVLLGTFTVHAMNLTGSLLFGMLLKIQPGCFVPAVLAALQLALTVWSLMSGGESSMREGTWRTMGALLAFACVLTFVFLPAHTVSVPSTLTENAQDAAAINRAPSMLSEALLKDGNLNSEKTGELFSNIASGDLKQLEPYASDFYNLQGIFQIKTSTSTVNTTLLAAIALLVLAAVLGLIPRVDKWFATVFEVAGALLLLVSVPGLMTVGNADMYATASRQLTYAGLGTVTPAPLLLLALAAGSAVCGIWSIRVANEPYFVNPLPQKGRLRLVALALAVVTIVLLLGPQLSMSFYRPGGANVQSTVHLTGLQSLTGQIPDEALHPVAKNGKTMYKEEVTKEGELPASAVEDVVRSISGSRMVTLYIALALIVAATCALMSGKAKKLSIILYLSAALVQLAAWLLAATGMPQAVGTCGGTVFLYVSLGTLVFAAFFANMSDEEQLPKKYKLFLLMLPFLVLVFLFSYLPLYGWSYAFYNYKFGLPMNQQEFVGLKWFTEMFTTQSGNIMRVMKNTLGMSLINLATSWLPMVFAIFLNEITRTRFKKFVQIFTTLPNFISWALVFSFAMCMFAMETGIVNKAFLQLGIIQEPVAWLNSSEHIWLKMWAWNTWKGLGWGAIMYLAAIAGIDQELYEAARVDGANRWAQMWYITLPGLLPTFFVLLMLSISNILNNGMDQYLVFQNPMNKASIEVLDLYVYNITIASRSTTMYSFAIAVGILKTIVGVTLLFSANFASKKLRGESIV